MGRRAGGGGGAVGGKEGDRLRRAACNAAQCAANDDTPPRGNNKPPTPTVNSLEKGTTYNSYLIFGPDATALVDTSHEKFTGLYIKVISHVWLCV